LYFLSPTELTIQATGTLQPIQQTLVFAPSDGFVDSVPVSDGQLVQKNEPVAVLSSPSLQLQLNQIDSEIAHELL
jgi:multidrug efflux pump subunit AcrA (membrane-fusion protein)